MHIPVLKMQTIEYLNPQSNENFIDCTFGEGGHSKNILEMNGPEGKVLGIEIDTELYNNFQKKQFDLSNKKLFERLILINNSYIHLRKIVEQHNFKPIDGVLLDAGISNWHLKESGRGFSFQKDEPLDMRYNPKETPLTAYEIVNSFSEQEIEKILKDYGEEKFARQIAKKIVEKRAKKPLKTTLDLVEVIWSSLPSWYKHKGIHPATKTFQALRILVNSELDNLGQLLNLAADVLSKNGRLVVISFHSLEDRIVKKFFQRANQINMFEILTKKPIVATEEEIESNPKSRSAKLRVARKIIN
jgi:16S rRNA (cytosine1402-N4)-methyltransferase